MKKILLFLILINSFAFSAIELSYDENINPAPVIRAGLKEAKRNIQTTFVYNKNDMYKIYCREGFITTINLNPDEKIVYLAGGDTARWAIAEGQGENNSTIIVIKPFYEGLQTNLIVNTNKRSYNFYLYSAKNWLNPVVNFVYPNSKMATINREKKEIHTSTLVNINSLNFNYEWNNKNKNWSPIQVYDDGHKTYIIMKPEIKEYSNPILTVRDNQTGKIILTRYRYNPTKNMFIIDGLFTQAVLKLGKKEILIKRIGSFIKNTGDYYPVNI